MDFNDPTPRRVPQNIETKWDHRVSNGDMNKLYVEDRPAHNWYRFVLSFPPHLVRDYVKRFSLDSSHCVLDPFCGTGTTIVECKKLGIPSIGVEANPMAFYASRVKTDWSPSHKRLIEHSYIVAKAAVAELENEGIEDAPIFHGWQSSNYSLDSLRTLEPEKWKLLLKDSISPLPLHQ